MNIRSISVITACAVAVVGFGAATATATQGHVKPSVCHPVEGNGETGYGWNIIGPDEASKHIDEETGEGKHTRKDGRTDVYADEQGHCPGYVEPTPTPSVSETATPTPSETESATPTPTPSESESETPTPTPTDSETPTLTPSETGTSTPTPPASETVTPTPSPSESETATPTPTATETPTPTATSTTSPPPSPSVTQSVVPSPSDSEPPQQWRLAQTGAEWVGPAALLGCLLIASGGVAIAASRQRGRHQ